MVRKVMRVGVAILLLLITATATCGAVSAQSYTTYDGNISSTQLTYFRDILPDLKLTDNYVCFRADQNNYIMVVGDLEFNGSKFILNGEGRVYELDSSGTNYQNYYIYDYYTTTDFTLTPNNKIVYSDIGNYPQLEERGQKYEILAFILMSVACVCSVIRGIFYFRKR